MKLREANRTPAEKRMQAEKLTEAKYFSVVLFPRTTPTGGPWQPLSFRERSQIEPATMRSDFQARTSGNISKRSCMFFEHSSLQWSRIARRLQADSKGHAPSIIQVFKHQHWPRHHRYIF